MSGGEDHSSLGSPAGPRQWPALAYDEWRATCETLHAQTQVLGKLAATLAPAEPHLQHSALRLTVRGWETAPLPAPDGSGALAVALDLRSHEVVIEHSDGRLFRTPLIPDRPVGDVTREVLDAIGRMVGTVQINLVPQEVPWAMPLDRDDEHTTYDPLQVATYFAAATRAASVLAELRAPYRGRSSPVNAWWGAFDLAITLFSGQPAAPPSDDFIIRNSSDAEQVAVGWWPGDPRYPRAAFYAYAFPAPDGLEEATLVEAPARWDTELREYILDWDDVIASPDPYRTAVHFGRSFIDRACTACAWDPSLAASAQGVPPPVK